MANLLTNEAKQALRQDFLNRKLVVVGLIFTLLFSMAVIVMGAFWASLFVRESGLESVSQAVKNELNESNIQPSDLVILKRSAAEAKALEEIWKEERLSNLVNKIFAQNLGEIKISGLVIERSVTPGSPIKLVAVGTSPSRDEIVRYVDSLRGNNFFSQVELPVESLINETGGQFVINIEK